METLSPTLNKNTAPFASAVESPSGTRGVYISTYGCQMNVHDTERMYSVLEMMNYHAVPAPELADLVLINSCSVREKPVHKVYSEVGKFRKLKERNPALRIGVGGCVASQEKEKLMKAAPLIDFVFGTDNIDELPEIVQKLEEGAKKFATVQFRHKEPYVIQTLIRNPGVTTFVNIMKGCDNFCSFCIVPFTRGREKSRGLSEVVEDIQKLTLRGVKEITLLGQNVNSYRSPGGEDFADLLRAIALDTDIERIRYTTSHPKDFNEKLAQTMAAHAQKICEYVHLPVQSGSNEVLRQMNRGYTVETYIEKMKMIREHLPNVVFSTDLIVGFPGETEDDFRATLELVEKVEYETLFAFKYSPRPFTKAAKMTNQVLEEVKEARLARLFDANETQADLLVKRYEGQTLSVLVEKYDPERRLWHGRSTQNKNVYFESENVAPGHWIGKTIPVRIEKARPNVLRGALA